MNPSNGHQRLCLLSVLLLLLLCLCSLSACTAAPAAGRTLGSATASGPLAAPAITHISNHVGGIRLSWASVSGTSSYGIYRASSPAGSYQAIGTTSDTEFVDSTAESGATYYYKVSSVSDSAQSAGSAVRSILCLSAPDPVCASTTVEGILFQWSEVPGAEGYEVYRKLEGEASYTKLTSTAQTAYTDTSALPGERYCYTVRAVNGTASSSYQPAGIAALIAFDQPELSCAADGSTVQLTWTDVPYAAAYHIYRCTASTSWEHCGTTTDTTYTDPSLQPGATYLYTVLGVHGSKVTPYTGSALSVTGAEATPVSVSEAPSVTGGELVLAACENIAAQMRADGDWHYQSGLPSVSACLKQHRFSCGYFTTYCLQQAGYANGTVSHAVKKDTTSPYGASRLVNCTILQTGNVSIDDLEDLRPGDVLVRNPSSSDSGTRHHIAIFAYQSGDTYYFYSTSNDSEITTYCGGPSPARSSFWKKYGVTCIIRPNDP